VDKFHIGIQVKKISLEFSKFLIYTPTITWAGVAEQVDATDSKSVGIYSCGGSIPFSGIFWLCQKMRHMAHCLWLLATSQRILRCTPNSDPLVRGDCASGNVQK
jgi:hypothetical protein